MWKKIQITGLEPDKAVMEKLTRGVEYNRFTVEWSVHMNYKLGNIFPRFFFFIEWKNQLQIGYISYLHALL